MYKTILVAIDDSETSRCALNEALQLARNYDAKLYIAHVADETLLSMQGRTFSTTLNLDQALEAIVHAGQALLDQTLPLAAGLKAETVLLTARQQRVSEVLVAKAEELGADLIVLGRHGKRGLARLILGSVAEQVAKMTQVSVLLVRQH